MMHHLRRSTPVRGGIPVDKAGNRGLVQRDATCDHSSIRNAPGMRWARRDATPAPSRSTASCSTISHSEARPPPTGLVDQRSAVYRAALRCARARGRVRRSLRAGREDRGAAAPGGGEHEGRFRSVFKGRRTELKTYRFHLFFRWISARPFCANAARTPNHIPRA